MQPKLATLYHTCLLYHSIGVELWTHFWEYVDLPEAVVEVGEEGGAKVLRHLPQGIARVLLLFKVGILNTVPESV